MRDGARRATIYFDAEVQRALRLEAARTERSLSDLVNEAVKASLAEGAEGRTAFEVREPEPDLALEGSGTKLKLDRRLVREARKRAAETGQTLTQLLEKALREFLRSSASRAERFRFDPLVKRGRVVPGVEWDDRDSLYERMDEHR